METVNLGTVAEKCEGWTNFYRIVLTDLSGTGAATLVVNLTPLAVGDYVRNTAYYLQAAFTSGTVTALKLDVGVNGAATTLINQIEVLTATPAACGIWNGASADGGGYITTAAKTLQAQFTATGGNLTALTAGEVWIWIAINKLSVRK
jgi:hypothetical protein